MPLNEVDEILSGGSVPNSIGSQLDALEADETSGRDVALKQSMFVASTQQPDRQAEVQKLAATLNMPPAVVDRNFDKVNIQAKRDTTKYDRLLEENPGLSAWLSDPNNSGVASDDIDNLRHVENVVKEHTMLDTSFDAFYTGLSKANEIIGSVPAYAYELYHAPANAFRKLKGEDQIQAPAWLRDNDFVMAQRDAAKSRAPEELSQSALTAVMDGDYSKAGRVAFAQFVSNVPQLATMLAATYASGGTAGLTVGGVMSATDKANQNAAEGKVDPLTGTLNATATGALEAVFERTGTLAVIEKWKDAVQAAVGKQGAKEFMKHFGKTIGFSMFEEGKEEFQTSIAQDTLDYGTNVNPELTPQEAIVKGVDSFIGGAIAGGFLTGPSAGMNAYAKMSQANRTQLSKDFYLAFGKGAEAMKIRERLPEAAQKYVNDVTKGSGVENVFLPVQAVDAYFQSKGLNPLQAMQQMGALEQYNEAKETGADIQIPLSSYAQNVVGTEHYDGLQDNVKFNPDDLTPNQLKAERVAAKEIEQKAVQGELPIEADIDQQAKDIGKSIAAQLEEAGSSPKDAKITEEYIKTQAIRNNMTPQEVFELLPLTVSKDLGVQKNQAQVFEHRSKAEQERLARAKEMGFNTDETYFHGTNSEFDNFDSEQNKRGMWGQGSYFSQDEGEAGTYGKRTIKAFLRTAKVFDVFKNETPKNFIDHIKKNFPKEHAELKKVVDPKDAYNYIDAAKSLITPEQFTKLFKDAGYDALKMSDIINVFDPKNIRLTEAEFRDSDSSNIYAQTNDNEVRGTIEFSEEGAKIRLGKAKDVSTFIHESGHWFLEVQKRLAARENAPQQVKDDWAETLKYLGVESADQIKREHHEKFAESYEVYAAEGRSPSEALRKTFARFKVFMTSVYKNLIGSGVKLDPSIRAVFDRMLATDEALENARAEMNRAPFPQNLTDMNDDQYARYIRANKDAALAANEQMAEKVMKVYEREKSKWYKEEVAKVTENVTAEVSQQRLYWGTDILKKGYLPDGTRVKIDRASFVEKFGADAARAMPRGVFGTDGLHYGMVSDILGFRSGGDMVAQMLELPSKEESIKQKVDKIMSTKYPDILLPLDLGSTQQQQFNLQTREDALNAIHSNDRALVLRMELEHLAKNNLPVLKDVIRRVARRVPTNKDVRNQAEEIIAGKKANDIKPHLYSRAEARAAKEAGILLAKGDIEGAFEAKKRELLNYELYRAAVDAQDTIESSLEKFKKVARSDEKLSKTRDTDIVNAARAILSTYGIGSTDRDAASYLSQLKSYDPDGYETAMALVNQATLDAGPWDQIPFTDFLALSETIDALWDLSKTRKEISVDGKNVAVDQAFDELKTRLGEVSKPGDASGYRRQKSVWEKTKIGLMGMRSSLRRIEPWVDAMDGGNPDGPFRKYIYNPISAATTNYRLESPQFKEKFLEIIKPIESTLHGREVLAHELNYAFTSKAQLLGAILHTGNQSNLSKLIRGYGWGDLKADRTVDTTKWDAFVKRMWAEGILTKADYDVVQKIWDLNEELKPKAQKAHKEMYGYFFNEITAEQIVTPFGTYKGGYVPAVVDPFEATDAAIRNEREALENQNNSFMFPTTGRGFTKSRVDAYAAPLAMDISLVPGHIDKVLRFVHIEPAIKQVSRIVLDRGFSQQLTEFDSGVVKDMLGPWLQRTAQQKIMTPTTGDGGRAMDNFFRELRTRVGMQVMFANVTNALQQPTGLFLAATQVKPKYLRNALWNYVRGPAKMTADIQEKSDYMKTRLNNQSYQIQQTIDDLLLDPSKYDKARDFAQKHTYFAQSATQNIVDTIAWTGAYDNAVGQGHTEAEAVKMADSVVRETQGSMSAEDVSRFETGTAFSRMFTMFYTYFNMQANLLGTEFVKNQRQAGLRKGAGRALYLYTMGFAIPAFLSEIIVKGMAGRIDEDDDDEYMDDLMSSFFGSQFRSAAAMVPVVGMAATAVVNAGNDKWYDDRITTSPAVSMIESAIVGNSKNFYKLMAGEEVNKKRAVKDALTALGLMSGLPLAPFGRPASYLMDYTDGNVEPTGPVDFARGLITGKTGEAR